METWLAQNNPSNKERLSKVGVIAWLPAVHRQRRQHPRDHKRHDMSSLRHSGMRPVPHAPALAEWRQPQAPALGQPERRGAELEIGALLARGGDGRVDDEGALGGEGDDVLQSAAGNIDNLPGGAGRGCEGGDTVAR